MRILILLIFMFFSQSGNIRVEADNFNRTKRATDSCTRVAYLGITSGIFSELGSIGVKNILNPTSKLSAAGITSIVSSIVDLQSPTTCDLMNKLNEIIDKLDEISNSLKHGQHDIICDIYRVSFINEMLVKLDNHFNKYKNFQYNQKAFKDDFLNLCIQHDGGIEWLLLRLKIFLTGIEVKKNIKDCIKYQSNKFSLFFTEIAAIVVKLEAIYMGCVEAGQSKIIMDLKAFNKEINDIFEYYKHWTKEEFKNDPSVVGMKETIKEKKKTYNQQCTSKFPVTNEAFVNYMNENYNYWNWNVQSYSSSIKGYDWHCIYMLDNLYSQCGNMFNMRLGRCTSIISYYEKSAQSTTQIIDKLADEAILPTLNRW